MSIQTSDHDLFSSREIDPDWATWLAGMPDISLFTNDAGYLASGAMMNFDSGAITSDGSGNITGGSFVGTLIGIATFATQAYYGANTDAVLLVNAGGYVAADDGSPLGGDNLTFGGNVYNSTAFGASLDLSSNTGIIVAGGVMDFDSDNISSDGSGNLTAVSFIGDGSALTGVTATLPTEMSFDSGAITSDGSGNITATSFIGDFNGTFTGTFSGTITQLPYEFFADCGGLSQFTNDDDYLQVGAATSSLVNNSGFITLADVNSVAQDPNLSSDGSGNLSAVSFIGSGLNLGSGAITTNFSSDTVLNIIGGTPYLYLNSWYVGSGGGGGLQIGGPSFNAIAITPDGSVQITQAPTSSAPAYLLGAMYFDTTLNKLRIGGATGWETVTSV